MDAHSTSKDAELAYDNMGMATRERLSANKKSIFQSIAANPKIVFIALFAS